LILLFTTRDVDKGKGMWLKSADSIVKKHNGKIDVKSDMGRGSVFLLFYP